MKFLLCLLSLTCLLSAGPIELKDGDRIAFVGGTFVEREVEHSLIETYLTIANDDKGIKFFNFGWSADTVKGESRGYFKIEEGYALLLKKVTASKPTLIILAYGANASWNGPAGLHSFIKDYSKLIKDLKAKTSARIVLMSTPRQENLGSPYPNPAQHNKDQATYFAAIKQMAAQKKIPFVDIFNDIADVKGLTSNSIHLNKKGYEAVAQKLGPLTNSPQSAININASKPPPIINYLIMG